MQVPKTRQRWSRRCAAAGLIAMVVVYAATRVRAEDAAAPEPVGWA
jgi:hypothetical protein